jgi:predicted solute-binding protein
MHFRPSEAGCVFMDLCENVYDTTYFRDVVEKEFAVWASKSLKLPATVAEYERFLEKSHKFNLPRGI